MAKNKFGSYPLPAWLQSYMERNIGRRPIWNFPHIPDSPEGLSFEMLDFENRHHILEMFGNDSDPWVDERFKDPQQLYDYVAHLRIVMPYSDNLRSIAFLKKLGFRETRLDWEAEHPGKEPPEEVYLENFRSPQARGRVRNYWKRMEEKYRT